MKPAAWLCTINRVACSRVIDGNVIVIVVALTNGDSCFSQLTCVGRQHQDDNITGKQHTLRPWASSNPRTSINILVSFVPGTLTLAVQHGTATRHIAHACNIISVDTTMHRAQTAQNLAAMTQN